MFRFIVKKYWPAKPRKKVCRFFLIIAQHDIGISLKEKTVYSYAKKIGEKKHNAVFFTKISRFGMLEYTNALTQRKYRKYITLTYLA